jgi:hypothetical protein
MGIVHCIPETGHLLTKDTQNERGAVTTSVIDLDGNPIQDRTHYAGNHHVDAVEVYVDMISGDSFAKVPPNRLEKMRSDGVEMLQGAGGVLGWFVPAPDFNNPDPMKAKRNPPPPALTGKSEQHEQRKN